MIDHFRSLAMAEGEIWANLAPPENEPGTEAAVDSGVAMQNSDGMGHDAALEPLDNEVAVGFFEHDFSHGCPTLQCMFRLFRRGMARLTWVRR